MNMFPDDSYASFVALAYQGPLTTSLKYIQASSCLADRSSSGLQHTSVLAGGPGHCSPPAESPAGPGCPWRRTAPKLQGEQRAL